MTRKGWIVTLRIAVIAMLVAVVLTSIAYIAAHNKQPAYNEYNTMQPKAATTSTEFKPVDLTGTWKASGDSKVNMSAKIAAGIIEISMVDKNTTATYWYGTIDNPSAARMELTSKAVDTKVFLSSATSKVFVYHDGTLTFDLKMLGTTTQVELIRG